MTNKHVLIPDSSAPRRMLTCVTFDNGWNGVQGLNWLWVYSSGVQVKDSATKCLPGLKKCGYFDGSTNLEIPFFAMNYDHYEEFAISVFYKRTSAGQGYQGIISNDCFQTSPLAEANSLYVSSAASGRVSAGMRSDAESAGVANATVSDANV